LYITIACECKGQVKGRLICLTSEVSLAGPQDVHNSEIFGDEL